MGFIGKAFLRGLAAILPVAATAYILWWFLTGAESLMQDLLSMILESEEQRDPKTGEIVKQVKDVYHFPGLGIAAGIVLTLFVGLLLNNFLVRRLHDWAISLLERLPLVKTIYRMVKDMVSFFANTDREEAQEVVMVQATEAGPEMIGFLTCPDTTDLPEGIADEEKVGVFLPMSYQMGGFLVFVPRSRVRKVDMSMEEALRFSLAAGITSKKSS